MALFKREEEELDLTSIDLGDIEDLKSLHITKEMLEAELKRETYRSNFNRSFRNTIFSLIVVAAVVVILAMLFFPVLQISGTSMSNTLEDRDVVVAVKKGIENGDVVVFYSGNNNVLVKRVIAKAGQTVDMDADGNVFVNGKQVEEPYIYEKSIGQCDIAFPYQVPEGKVFVLGDHRSVSIDSRNSRIGCIDESSIVGKIIVRILPIKSFKIVR